MDDSRAPALPRRFSPGEFERQHLKQRVGQPRAGELQVQRAIRCSSASSDSRKRAGSSSNLLRATRLALSVLRSAPTLFTARAAVSAPACATPPLTGLLALLLQLLLLELLELLLLLSAPRLLRCCCEWRHRPRQRCAARQRRALCRAARTRARGPRRPRPRRPRCTSHHHSSSSSSSAAAAAAALAAAGVLAAAEDLAAATEAVAEA
jgi:hypothetical protein